MYVLCTQLLSCVQLFCDPMDCSLPSPPSMGFPRQEYWSGLPFPPPGDLPDPGIELMSPAPPALQAGSLPLSHLETMLSKLSSSHLGGGQEDNVREAVYWYKMVQVDISGNERKYENFDLYIRTSCPYVREMLTTYSKPTILEFYHKEGTCG